MSILSTNQRLIKVGQDYSAGSGIDITNHVISVTGEIGGNTYSAGDNIGIYEQDNQLYISGKDWANDIEQASANAYEQAISQIPEPQDLSYISGRVDTNTSGIDYISSVCLTAHQDWTDTIKGASSYSYEQSTSYFDNWISGQYTGDITTITNNISALSGNFGDYYKKTETSSKEEINDALQYVSANAGKVYEGVSPIVVNNVEDKISADTWTFSAGSNVSFVDDNEYKITRIDVELPPQDLSYISAQVDSANAGVNYLSGVVITALPSDLATTGDVADLAQSVSETYQVKGDYLTTADSANFYPANNPSGFISGVDLSNYYTKNETSSKQEISAAIANIPQGDEEVNNVVRTYSANGTWLVANDITGLQEKGNYYSASNPSGFLVSSDISSFASISLVEETSGAITALIPSVDGLASETYVQEQVSGKADKNEIPDVSNFITNVSAESTYQTLVGMSDYAKVSALTAYQPVGNYLSSNALNGYATESFVQDTSANITALIPSTAGLASEVYVQNNSAILTGMINAKQDALTFGYDDNNKINAINNSAIAGGGGAISSYTSAYSRLIQPYGGYVINSLNGSALSALESYSADRANYATNANSSNSAGYAQTVNVTNVENQGFIRNLSSEYGTISVVHNNIIDSTNSAILRAGYEGFTSALSDGESIGPTPYGVITFSWNNSLPNTTFNCWADYPHPNSIVYYSANTNLTGEIELPNEPQPNVNIAVPNATALDVWCNDYISIRDIVVSASDTFETVVGELAWASAIPTYEYNVDNKISAINGSALAGGGGVTGEFVPLSSFNELKQSYSALSSLFATYSGQWLLPNEGV